MARVRSARVVKVDVPALQITHTPHKHSLYRVDLAVETFCELYFSDLISGRFEDEHARILSLAAG